MKLRDVQSIDFKGSIMFITVDGQIYRVDLPSISSRLAKANDAARRSFHVSPSGYGIHWPEIDEDLSVNGIIAAAKLDRDKIIETPLLLKEEPPP